MKHYKFDDVNLTFVMIRHYTKPLIWILIFTICLSIGLGITMRKERRMIASEMRVILLERDAFSQDKLVSLIKTMNFSFPYIVLAQAIHESNNFTSPLFLENNNMMGMKEPLQRVNSANGSKRDYAYYNTWKESLYDYGLYTTSYLSKITSEDMYYSFLQQYYAEDPDYVNKIKNIIVTQNLKSLFIN